MARAASSHDALLPWLQSEGVPAQKVRTCHVASSTSVPRQWRLSSSGTPMQVAIHEGFPEGRGLIACSSIMAGERLLSIPQHLIMTPDAARESSAVRELLEAYPDLPDWSVLAVLLAENAAPRGRTCLQVGTLRGLAANSLRRLPRVVSRRGGTSWCHQTHPQCIERLVRTGTVPTVCMHGSASPAGL